MDLKLVTKANPNVKDLAEGLNSLHDCLEAHISTTKNEFSSVKGQLSVIASQQVALMQGLGMKHEEDHRHEAPADRRKREKRAKPIAAMTPWELAKRTAPFIGGMLPLFYFGVKILNAVWPSIMQALQAANQMILAQ